MCGGSTGAALSNIKKTTKKVVKKAQTTGADAAQGGKKALKSGIKKTQANLGGMADAGKAGLHAAADAGRTNLHVATDAGRAFLHEGADILKGAWDQARGVSGDDGGGGGTGADQLAMGTDTDMSEKCSGKMQKGQLGSKDQKRLNQRKDKFKVKVA